MFGSMSATPFDELRDQGQVACAKLETDILKRILLDCVAILEAAGWASAADDIPLPTKKIQTLRASQLRHIICARGGTRRIVCGA